MCVSRTDSTLPPLLLVGPAAHEELSPAATQNGYVNLHGDTCVLQQRRHTIDFA
eukprot:m.633987 g.633987  ORF g.633987 m.633987 type:complete len:54 (+) comp22581_c0_seq6:3234-3395(+)